ncbi:MAG: AIR synthase-related protein [Promethearchaeota archaeon]
MKMPKKLQYEDLGVSSQKDDVHFAIKDKDPGLFPSAFCKVIPDMFTMDEDSCLMFHADGAGTKTIISYLYWREMDDVDIFEGIAQDALVMNIDDLGCAGAINNFLVSNTIGRNKFLIPGEVIKAIIDGYEKLSNKMLDQGIKIHLCGGETADVGDLVRTVIVDCSVIVRMERNRVIRTESIKPGDVIVGVSSTGQASYEDQENSGISSNGITLARHVLISSDYLKNYPEILDPNVDKSFAYKGNFHLTDKMPSSKITIGQALSSPTRTYLPVLKKIFELYDSPAEYQSNLHGIIHNTGGGLTKCLRFGSGVKYVKNNLFPTPAIFSLIQQEGNIDWKEMYRVFNMGHRLEIICPEDASKEIIRIIKGFNIEAKIIGHIEKNEYDRENSLLIDTENGSFSY